MEGIILLIENENEKRYLEAYQDAIDHFVISENNSWKEITIESKESTFYKSFYDVAWKMLENGKDLSDKQLAIIEKEMRKKEIKIPQLKDYSFSISLPLHMEYSGKIYDDRIEFGKFIFLLNNLIEEIKKDYEDKFEEETHIEKYHYCTTESKYNKIWRN